MQDEIRKLVGIPYKHYSSDPSIGLDCMTTAKLVWRIIGEAKKQIDAWIFPMPANYTDTGMEDHEELMAYKAHWTQARYGEFGAIIDLGDHIGIYIGNGDVIHCQRGAGVVITRSARLNQHAKGWYKLINPGKAA